MRSSNASPAGPRISSPATQHCQRRSVSSRRAARRCGTARSNVGCIGSRSSQGDPGDKAMTNDRQSWDPRQYAENARFVSDLGAPVLALLDPKPGERILDLGCGDGALTRRIVEAGAIVVGIDASAAMVEAARALSIDARVMDGH